MKRSIFNIPEGGCHISDLHKYYVTDSPTHESLGEGVTREWCIVFCEKDRFYKTDFEFIRCDTKEQAFDFFIAAHPEKQVRALKYEGIYF